MRLDPLDSGCISPSEITSLFISRFPAFTDFVFESSEMQHQDYQPISLMIGSITFPFYFRERKSVILCERMRWEHIQVCAYKRQWKKNPHQVAKTNVLCENIHKMTIKFVILLSKWQFINNYIMYKTYKKPEKRKFKVTSNIKTVFYFTIISIFSNDFSHM